MKNNQLSLGKRLLSALAATALLGGCSTVMEATHDGPIEQDPGKRSLGTYIDDERIETIVTVNINKAHPDLKTSNIDVTSFNGVVLLTGQVPDQELRLLAGRTASQVQNVRQVYNETQVRGKVTFLATTSDAWLTTKVKTNLLAHKEIDGARIKVVTENGVVYLMGLLTPAEAERAADLTRSIGGVQKVVKAVEYIN
ncbi:MULTISPECIES: BON domain-containing protein [Microbulbifer]|uniref:BON domain-containing protein n=1 Tax=Microbulbifer TaxID=48073 RepID=UPI0012A8FCAC|nr:MULTISPECIES: BON domain-containing protein [Microbulbifer]QFT55981.1 Osmotically-inducible protein Y precursor [Microbulbifer sp. THAF38]